MKRLAAILTLVAAPVAAEQCFLDKASENMSSAQIDGTMRSLMIAHMPIEYRNSCGFRDDSDQGLFNAIRASVGCSDSLNYAQFFGMFMSDQQNYLMAMGRTDFRSDENYNDYCAMVSKLDLNAAVREDGTINAEMMQAQAPLLSAIQAFQKEWSWR